MTLYVLVKPSANVALAFSADKAKHGLRLWSPTATFYHQNMINFLILMSFPG